MSSTKHFVRIGDGQYVQFQLVKEDVGYTVHAPGVIPFDVSNREEAKHVLYALLCKESTADGSRS